MSLLLRLFLRPKNSFLILVPLLRIGDEVSSSSEFGRGRDLARVRTLIKLGSFGLKLRRDARRLLDLLLMAEGDLILGRLSFSGFEFELPFLSEE